MVGGECEQGMTVDETENLCRKMGLTTHREGDNSYFFGMKDGKAFRVFMTMSDEAWAAVNAKYVRARIEEAIEGLPQ